MYIIFWCVICMGYYVLGTLLRVSYRVPGCLGEVFAMGTSVFFFSPTFFDTFLFKSVSNLVWSPILAPFWWSFHRMERPMIVHPMKTWYIDSPHVPLLCTKSIEGIFSCGGFFIRKTMFFIFSRKFRKYLADFEISIFFFFALSKIRKVLRRILDPVLYLNSMMIIFLVTYLQIMSV